MAKADACQMAERFLSGSCNRDDNHFFKDTRLLWKNLHLE